MLICPAKVFDIPAIMAIEHNAFIPQIQEKEKIFQQRLSLFPQGFFVLQDCSDDIVLRNGKSLTVGYFCSELWANSDEEGFLKLGHSPKKSHYPEGRVLYISSFAILSNYRGTGEGKKFFIQSLNSICSALPQIQTVVLLVSEDWQGAKHIYREAGFTETKRLEGFFPSLQKEDGAAGIVMKCPADTFRRKGND